MPAVRQEPVLRFIRKLAVRKHIAQLTNGDLLHQFITARDDEEFAALVRRHHHIGIVRSRRCLPRSTVSFTWSPGGCLRRRYAKNWLSVMAAVLPSTATMTSRIRRPALLSPAVRSGSMSLTTSARP